MITKLLEKVTEIWAPVVGFEKSYMVSNIGRVKSLDRVIFIERVRNGKKQRYNIKFVEIIKNG